MLLDDREPMVWFSRRKAGCSAAEASKNTLWRLTVLSTNEVMQNMDLLHYAFVPVLLFSCLISTFSKKKKKKRSLEMTSAAVSLILRCLQRVLEHVALTKLRRIVTWSRA